MAVSFRGVRFSWHEEFPPLTFSLPASGIAAFHGRAKSGKTAALLAIIGGIKPVAGEISVLGMDPLRQTRAIRQRVGLSFVEGIYEPYFSLTVADNCRFQAALQGQKIETRTVETLLSKVRADFGPDEVLFRLDPLRRLKVGIALALIGSPEIVLVDEPFRSLKRNEEEEVKEIFRELKGEGRLVVFTTVKEGELDIADQVIDMEKGVARK